MLDITALEAALSQIEEVGQGEATFDFNGIPITMRVLLPKEELEIQKYASVALEEGSDESAQTVDYLDRFKISLLSHSIIAVGDLDFRDVEFVATGEALPNGKQVKIHRVEAVRKLAQRWSRPSILMLFKKYSELLEAVEKKAEEAVEFEPTDFDSEIERLENLIAEVKSKKEAEHVALGHMNPIRAQIKDFADLTAPGTGPTPTITEIDPNKASTEKPHEASTEKPQNVSNDGERRSSIPQQAAPPSDVRQEYEVPPSDEEFTDFVDPEEGAPPLETDVLEEMSKEDVLSHIPDSFMDGGDIDDVQSATEVEHTRLLRQRQLQQQREQATREATTTHTAAPTPGRKPPHVGAQQTSDNLSQSSKTVDGQPAYNVGGGEITGPRPQLGADPNLNVDGTEPLGTRNPRFRPPNKS